MAKQLSTFRDKTAKTAVDAAAIEAAAATVPDMEEEDEKAAKSRSSDRNRNC